METENFEKNTSSKALRFISAYNLIDNTLRSVYDFRKNMNFSDIIHRASSLNSVVRKYEDKLIDYGRLRNAIVHNTFEDIVIAEPHENVVDEFEKIAELVSAPPKALETIATREVVCVQSDENIKSVMVRMSQKGYKSMPVYKDNLLVGVINAGRLLEMLGDVITKGEDLDEFVEKTPIFAVIEKQMMDNYYAVVEENATIDKVLDLFSKNRKMLAVLLTPNGNYLEKPKGIITVADVANMNKILDLYN